MGGGEAGEGGVSGSSEGDGHEESLRNQRVSSLSGSSDWECRSIKVVDCSLYPLPS